ncbi:uncharacterized protein LOC121525212 [Cheilinus undulatus]|uniref:uncharacterized protein LOC121525212 n=1 Tax=Cheilinus undulatus TaxID=241271 RepID=UPI001BD3EC25|nr:uncharacterized protein LOC121525212 [Cheilinus undulatus]
MECGEGRGEGREGRVRNWVTDHQGKGTKRIRKSNSDRSDSEGEGYEQQKNNRNISSKYDSIPKQLSHSGSPNIYKLLPKTQNIGTLTRLTLGTKDVTKLNKTILLVGETGSGKSTLINSLVNYAMGVEWEDNVWFDIIEEKKSQPENPEEKDDQSKSQTSDVVVYEIFGFEDRTLPYSLTVIDTPGYGDTRGTECDDIVSERLLDLFGSEDGVHEITAVGLVLKATENRVSDRQRYIYDSVLSVFGKNMENNIIALITHSNGKKPKNVLTAIEAAKIMCARDDRKQPIYFQFDNCQNEDRDEDEEDPDHASETTKKGMRQFTEFLGRTEPRKLQVTVTVLEERKRLQACIGNLQERVKFIEEKQNAMKKNKEAIDSLEKDMKTKKDIKVEIEEVYKEKEKFAGGRKWYALWWNSVGSVCCERCEENCHPDCNWYHFVGDCHVFENNKCTVCTNKCDVKHHVKAEWWYVQKKKTVQRTPDEILEEIKKKHAECKDLKSVLEKLKKEEEDLQKEKDKLLEDSFQHIVRLEQIALKVDSLSILVHLDLLIKKMEEKGNTEKIMKLKEMRDRVDEGMEKGMQYKRGTAGEKEKTAGKQ